MVRTAVKWVLIGGSLVGAAPALGWLWNALVRAGDGGPSATVLVSHSAALGIVALLASFGVAGGLGALSARLYGARGGYMVCGLALAGPAWASGAMIDLLRWADAPKAFVLLSVEGAVVGLLTVASVRLINGVANRRAAERGEARLDEAAPMSAPSMLGFCGALAGGAAGAWLVARESTAGQTLAAGIAGGVAGGVAARLLSPRTPIVTIVAAVGALGIAAPIVARSTAGAEALRAIYEQRLVNIGLLLPLDWSAGSLLGIPLGVAWAASMTDKKAAKPSTAG